MTVVVGAPDWGQSIQSPFRIFNSAIGVFPTTVTLDCVRWPYSLIEFSGDPAGGAAVTLSALWSDVQGQPLVTNYPVLAVTPAGVIAKLRFVVQNIGATVAYTVTSAGVQCSLGVTHQLTGSPFGLPSSPNMAGRTIASKADVLVAGAFIDHVVRGAGSVEIAGSEGYVGNALLSVRGGQGLACAATIINAAGQEIGQVAAAGGGGLAAGASQAVWLPPEQYTLRALNGAGAQTVITGLIATE